MCARETSLFPRQLRQERSFSPGPPCSLVCLFYLLERWGGWGDLGCICSGIWSTVACCFRRRASNDRSPFVCTQPQCRCFQVFTSLRNPARKKMHTRTVSLVLSARMAAMRAVGVHTRKRGEQPWIRFSLDRRDGQPSKDVRSVAAGHGLHVDFLASQYK